MADGIITDLGAIPVVAAGDVFHAVDISDTTDDLAGSSKKATIAQLATHLASLAQTLTNKSIDSDNNTITNIVNADIKAAAAIALNKLAALTASELMVTDGSGFATTSAGVTATEAAFLNGVTSAIQTQLDAKRIQGKETIWIPAGAMLPTVTAGCAALVTVETTAGRPNLQVLDFDPTTVEHAQFSVGFPKSWNLGTVTFRAVCTHAGGQTGGLDGVAWELAGLAVGDTETIDAVYGTGITVVEDLSTTALDLSVFAESGAVTIGGTPADNNVCFFDIARDPVNVADDMDQDARLKGIWIFYTVDAEDDA